MTYSRRKRVKTPNLHDIDERIQAIVHERIDPETGEVFEDGDESAAKLLMELGEEREHKIIHCALYMDEHLREAAKIKEVEQRLAKRRKRHEADAAFLKAWVESVCEAHESFETPEIKVTFRKSTRLEPRDMEMVPKEIIRTKTTEALDKALAKKWIEKYGDTPPGVEEIPCKNMQIK